MLSGKLSSVNIAFSLSVHSEEECQTPYFFTREEGPAITAF